MDTNGVTDTTFSAADDVGVAPDQLDGLATVLDLIRSGAARTRPELAQRSGLGRTVITLRLAQLINFGLVEEGGLGRSTGGRAPRELRFRAEAGVVLAAEFGATSLSVGVTDLTGRVIEHREESDVVANFLAARCEIDEKFMAKDCVSPTDLKAAFVEYCRTQSIPYRDIDLRDRLVAMKHSPPRQSDKKYWPGIKLIKRKFEA